MEDIHTASDPSPFHPGERAVQLAAGVRGEAEKRGRRMLSAELNAQQVAFFQALPFLVTAHLDDEGQPWAGLLTGAPGFVFLEAESGHCVIDWRRAANPSGLQFSSGGAVGLLGIDLATKRRNRLNGQVLTADAEALRIGVQQGYGNCPKYITEREWPAAIFSGAYHGDITAGMSPYTRSLAARSDTFFIATASGTNASDTATRTSAWGADVSHRGGEPGFLQASANALRFADFPGNNMFNTLGNIERHPPCSILLLDFANGEFVQLAGRGAILPTGAGRDVVIDVSATRHWRKGGSNA